MISVRMTNGCRLLPRIISQRIMPAMLPASRLPMPQRIMMTSSTVPPTTGAVRRWLIFICGVCIMSVGIALSVHGQLGTAPISTFPVVIGTATSWSVGTVTAAMNIVFVGIQALILGRQFPLFQLVQLPVAVLFGTVIDLSLFLTRWAETDTYLLQWVVTIIGAITLGVGVSIQVQPKLLYLPGEGLVMALTQ